MDQLWAPWRHTFLTRKRARRCVFCAAKRGGADRLRRVVARGRDAFALLNLYPYTNGHLLVAPYRHVGTLEQLTDEEWTELGRLTRRLVTRVRVALRPHGFNIGVNLGRVAGAGIPGHLHLHIVPRWQGDTNFMPVVSGTRILSQSLDRLYALLTSRTP